MNALTQFDTRMLNRALVGFDRLFDNFEIKYAQQVNSNYPPYNVIKHDDNNYAIELAVAGFKRSDINIELENNVLTIRTINTEPKTTTGTYLWHGLSSRSFVRQFTLTDDLVIKGACLEDGVLKIGLEHVVPDEKKPRQIPIN